MPSIQEILTYLLRQNNSVEKIEDVLNKSSGLRGISGVSGDMRSIREAIAQGNSRAQTRRGHLHSPPTVLI